MTDFDMTVEGNYYPHQKTIPLGNGQDLTIQYRAVWLGMEDNVLALVEDRLHGLGFDPKPAFNALTTNETLTDEQIAALDEAMSNFDEADKEELKAVSLLISGARIAAVVGKWSFESQGQPVPVTPENCAKLPPDLKRAIMALAQGAVLPTERRNFSGASRRS